MTGTVLGGALITAVLFAASVYLLLSRRLISVLMGLAVLTHATNLLLLVMSGDVRQKYEPIVKTLDTAYVDPLPQALILTAIVIGFGVTAFMLVYLYRLYKTQDTLEIPYE